jgi:hypothetical protein
MEWQPTRAPSHAVALAVVNLETPEGLASTDDTHKCYPRLVVVPRRPVHPFSVVQTLLPRDSRDYECHRGARVVLHVQV